jgi:hypothetical protein
LRPSSVLRVTRGAVTALAGTGCGRHLRRQRYGAAGGTVGARGHVLRPSSVRRVMRCTVAVLAGTRRSRAVDFS